MKYIKIINDGEIDINSLLLIGASTKRGDENKIGFFGSGLKYSIAILARNNILPVIYSGSRRINIETRPQIFREQTFNQIIIDGKETSLTAEMGPDWKAWYAIREIYCNAIDEGNGKLELAEEAVPLEGKTHFFIENTGIFDEILFNWDKYFTNKRKDLVLTSDKDKIFFGSEQKIVYRRGVRCYSYDKPSLYHYDLNDVEINESRVASNSFILGICITRILIKSATTEMAKNIFDNYSGHVESEFSWDWDSEPKFNANWLEAIGGRKLIMYDIAGKFQADIARGNCLVLPNRLCKALKACFKEKVTICGESDKYGNHFCIEHTPKHNFIIDQSKAFLSQSGIDFDYPIKVCVFESSNILGCAENGTIFISDECFTHGKRKVVETIIEEYVHLKYEVNDETRAMQDVLINNLISSYERISGVYL